MTEDYSAHRPGKEADPVRREGQQGPLERSSLGEEELAEHQRCGRAVQEEVVPLDRSPDKAREGYLPDRGRLPRSFTTQSLHDLLPRKPTPVAVSTTPQPAIILHHSAHPLPEKRCRRAAAGPAIDLP